MDVAEFLLHPSFISPRNREEVYCDEVSLLEKDAEILALFSRWLENGYQAKSKPGYVIVFSEKPEYKKYDEIDWEWAVNALT